MRYRRAIFAVLTLSSLALTFIVSACKDDPPSEFVDPKGPDGAVPDRTQIFLTDTGTETEGGVKVECKPSLPTTFASTFTPPAKKQVCTADDIKGYYDSCLPNLKKQPCTDWLAAHAECAKCIEAPDAKGPVQIFRDRYYYTLNNAGCIALIQGKDGDDSCAKAYDTSTSCRRAACDGCFSDVNATFKNFTDCQQLAITSSCKDRETTTNERCVTAKPGYKDPDGGAPQCFASATSEDPKEVYTRITNAFCLKP